MILTPLFYNEALEAREVKELAVMAQNSELLADAFPHTLKTPASQWNVLVKSLSEL